MKVFEKTQKSKATKIAARNGFLSDEKLFMLEQAERWNMYKKGYILENKLDLFPTSFFNYSFLEYVQ